MGPHKPLNVFLFNVTLGKSSLASHLVLLEEAVVPGAPFRRAEEFPGSAVQRTK